MASFREWEQCVGTRFVDVKNIRQPALVVTGIHDEMIPVSNPTRWASTRPTRCCSRIPTSGHGALFQFHESFTRQAAAFLASDSPFAY
jgi:pimeloyl-ACP methyl ester carboxylesterase